MSAELLREAAAKMRERAEAAPAGSPWTVSSSRTSHWVVDNSRSGIAMAVADVFPSGGSGHQRQMAEHVASWHPAVALAVANWLDAEAAIEERTRLAVTFDGSPMFTVSHPALAVARAYLGGER